MCHKNKRIIKANGLMDICKDSEDCALIVELTFKESLSMDLLRLATGCLFILMDPIILEEWIRMWQMDKDSLIIETGD